jgi:hypothetical protein
VDHPFGKLEVFLWRQVRTGSDAFLVSYSRAYTGGHSELVVALTE